MRNADATRRSSRRATPAGKNGSVTARDVARMAGVSQATVSYVLNDRPDKAISAATRERILQAVRDLDYQPSAAARALRRGTADTVLYVLPNWPVGPPRWSFIDRLSVELDRLGLSLLVRREREDQPLSAVWRDVMPRAMLTTYPLAPSDREELTAAGVHLPSFITGGEGRAGLSRREGLVGHLQVQHLHERGHSRLGYALPHSQRHEPLATPRLHGFRDACHDLGLDEPVVVTLKLEQASAVTALKRWCRGRHPVTAIGAYNDDHAFAVLSGLHALKLTAPEDLAVIGVDNLPLAAVAAPPLTTLDQQPDLVARHTAAAIVDGLAGHDIPTTLGPESMRLIVRAST
jgi:DNA-binding LacI/PurR family transcriptional regulator